jgi:uncharacterized protein involved in response to NO
MGALWSAAALLVWIVIFVAGGSLPSRFDPLGWHIHEMLFGFVMATIAGFLPTAMWLLKIVSGLAQMPRWVILTSG